MNLFALSGLFAFITTLTLGAFSLIKSKNKLHVIWSAFNFSAAIWGFGAYKFSTTLNQNEVFFWLRLGHIGVILLPVFFVHFIDEYLKTKKKAIVVVTYVIGILFIVVNCTDSLGITNLLITNLRFVFNSFYVDSPPGPIYPFFVFFFFACVVYPHYLEFMAMRHSSSEKRMQLFYFMLSTALGFTGGGTAFLMVFKLDVYPIYHFTMGLYPVIMTYAIFRYRLMDIRVAITRAGIFLFVYAFILGFPFYFGFKTNLWILSTVIMAILASLGPLIFNALRHKAESILLAEQKRYQEILLQASEGMVHEHDLNRLLKLTVYLIKKSVKTNYAAVYLDDSASNKFILRSYRDSGKLEIPKEFEYDHPFIKYLEGKNEPFTYNDMPDPVKKSIGTHTDIGLVVPSEIKGSFLGFLVMGHKLNKTMFTIDDINIFKIISNQAAIAVLNCLYTERAKREQERTYKAERLSTIGAMATGVAHQFRNRLNNFVTIAGGMELDLEDIIELSKNAKEKGLDFSGFIESMQQVAKRIHKCAHQTTDIIQGVIDFSSMEAQDPALVEFKLSGFIGPCKSMLSVKHGLPEGESIPLKSELDENDFVFGDRVLLFKAVYNAIDNSYEAIEEKLDTYLVGKEKEDFVPEIKIGMEQKDKVSLIKISDNGIGIKEEDKKKVFAPYYTSKVSSKPSHSGVGMYSVKRSIEELLGGRVWIESEYTKGATFYIEIPRKPKA